MEIRPEAVAEWVNLPAEERPRLIDCREEDELAICQIAGNEWYPLGLFPGVKEKLKARNERGVVVYCHHGVRSLRATHFLRSLLSKLRTRGTIYSTCLEAPLLAMLVAITLRSSPKRAPIRNSTFRPAAAASRRTWPATSGRFPSRKATS